MMIERILYNGTIVTLDPQRPRAAALAISGGRIVAVGTDTDILPLATRLTKTENLNGKTVIPGLVDAHMHWEMTSNALSDVDVFEVPAKQIAADRVAQRAADTPTGLWIFGHGWTQDFWQDRAFPTAADLDQAAPTHPVCLRAKSGHAIWVNSLALQICGIDAQTPDPDGGQIVRDSAGRPTGVLFENAMSLITQHISPPTPDQLAARMKNAQTLALASGLTGFHDFDTINCLRALQILRERGELSLRVVKNINKEWIHHALGLGLRWGFGDDWIRIGAQKIFADGALGPRTAFMIAAYEGEPDNFGIATIDKEEMAELVSAASAAGLPSTIHAIGDRAVHDVLDVLEAVRKQEAQRGEARSARRHRIEHVQLIHPDDVHRLAQLDIIASMQPLHATSDYQMADRYWGKRSKWSYNARLQIDHGVKVAFGSDSPIEPFAPLKGIHAAVTRRRADGSPGVSGWYPEARLTVDEALRGFTIGCAYAAGAENRLGKLAQGFLADLVVLDHDLYHIAPDDILNVQIVATMVDGVWRHGEL